MTETMNAEADSRLAWGLMQDDAHQGPGTRAQANLQLPRLLLKDSMKRAWKELLAWGRQVGLSPPWAPAARRKAKAGGEIRHPVGKSCPLPRLWSQPSLITDTSFMVAG